MKRITRSRLAKRAGVLCGHGRTVVREIVAEKYKAKVLADARRSGLLEGSPVAATTWTINYGILERVK